MYIEFQEFEFFELNVALLKRANTTWLVFLKVEAKEAEKI